ncbi:MAG TPA: hypothetical protein VFX59_13295 [Polyangiales bacterium]|nr:hypothetical protein [Polyangiales bacterium]
MLRVTAAALLAIVAGCSDAKVVRSDELLRPEGLQAALENPIIDCQAAAQDCTDGAADFDARIACNDELVVCLRDAAKRAQDIAQLVEACREDGRVCLQDGTDEDLCRDNYDLCTDAALASDAGIIADAGAAVDSGVTGPSVPGLPTVDGGLDNLPAPLKCTIELRLCVAIDLSAAFQCADTARLCLQLP